MLGNFDFYFSVVELAVAQSSTELLACCRTGVRVIAFLPAGRQERIEDTFLGGFTGANTNTVPLLEADHPDSQFDQISHQGFDIASNIADFGEF